MTLTRYPDLVQGSPEWLKARSGIVTASVVGNLISTRSLSAIDYDCPDCGAPAGGSCLGKRQPTPIKSMHPERTAKAAAGRSSVIFDVAKTDNAKSLTTSLVAERITGHVESVYVSDDMIRGNEEEPIARDMYSDHHAPVDELGFMVREDWGIKLGYSPDGLVGEDGLIEIKSRRQKKQVSTVVSGTVPAENMAQCQAALLVTDRKWLDYVSFSSGMHLWVKRVFPDPRWFEAIINAVRAFEDNARETQRIYNEETQGLPVAERVVINLTPEVELDI